MTTNPPAASDLPSKIVEGVFQRVEGLPMIQVVGFDIRDDPHDRRQREERTIALVGPSTTKSSHPCPGAHSTLIRLTHCR